MNYPIGSGQYDDATNLTVITMHQPWASLLVYGIKRIEGKAQDAEQKSGRSTCLDMQVLSTAISRSQLQMCQVLNAAGRVWPAVFRGRLWIHAAAQVIAMASCKDGKRSIPPGSPYLLHSKQQFSQLICMHCQRLQAYESSLRHVAMHVRLHACMAWVHGCQLPGHAPYCIKYHKGWYVCTQEPEPAAIVQLEAWYREVHDMDARDAGVEPPPAIHFPEAYPTGVLLGELCRQPASF